MEELTRDLVSRAVDEYGAAWVTQDPDRIAELFTTDAIYVERAFDASATMRGREAIREYWQRQICGKQSNIKFRHVRGEMVLDTERRVAVVMWLAEFDNFRHKREDDSAQKKVRFVQVAKLHFSDDALQISYLEEYAQGASGRKFNWPSTGIDEKSTPDSVLRDMLRCEPGAFATIGKAATCRVCGADFPSRAQLFKHLRQSGTCGRDANTGDNVNSASYDPPSVLRKPNLQKVSLSVSYWYPTRDISSFKVSGEEKRDENALTLYEETSNVSHSGAGLHQILTKRLTLAYMSAFPEFKSSSIGGSQLTAAWAVPPHRSLHACINIASILFPKVLVESLDDCSEIASRLDYELLRQAPESNAEELSRLVVRVRACNKVNQSFVPAQSTECQRYFGLVSVAHLLSGPAFMSSAKEDTTAAETLLHSRLHEYTRFFSGKTFSFHNFTTMSPQAIRSGKKKVRLRLNRVRAAGLPDPWSGKWISLKLTAKYLIRGMLSKIFGTIVALVRGDLSLSRVKAALQIPEDVEMVGSVDASPDSITTLEYVDMPTFPEHHILLVSPVMARFESKNKLKLCLSRSCWEESGSLGENVVKEAVSGAIDGTDSSREVL